MKVNLSLVDVTICTNKNNIKVIRDLQLPFNVIEKDSTIISSIKSYAVFKTLYLLFKKICALFDSYDVSIDTYRWRSGFFIEQALSFFDSVKLNRFNSKQKINFSKSELAIHEQFMMLGNIPHSHESFFSHHIKNLANRNELFIRFDVIIHPFSSEKSRIINYELILKIINLHPNEQILLLGVPSDDVSLVLKLNDLKLKNLVVKIKYFDFFELAQLIMAAKIIYGSESFVSNFASLLGAKVYGFFSGVADPNQWYLPGPNSTTFKLDVPCSPCFNKIACNNECLNLFSFSRVQPTGLNEMGR
jgi:ADP-heptose:LPS heptosyltransferase